MLTGQLPCLLARIESPGERLSGCLNSLWDLRQWAAGRLNGPSNNF